MKSVYQAGIYVVVIILALLLSTLAIYAQSNTEPVKNKIKPQFGIRGGVNLANFSKTEFVQNQNLKIGYNFGVFARLPINRFFFVQPELLHSTKGARLVTKNSNGETTGGYSFDLSYVEVPMILAFQLDPNMHIYAGGYVAYLTSASAKTTLQGSENTNNPGRGDFRNLDYGLLGGVGVDIEKFTIGMRYTSGLSNIGEPQSGIAKNLSNNALSIYLSFTI